MSSHVFRTPKWTRQAVLQTTTGFTSRVEWIKAHKQAYNTANSRGWLGACYLIIAENKMWCEAAERASKIHLERVTAEDFYLGRKR